MNKEFIHPKATSSYYFTTKMFKQLWRNGESLYTKRSFGAIYLERNPPQCYMSVV